MWRMRPFRPDDWNETRSSAFKRGYKGEVVMSRMKPAAVLAVVSVITLGLSACGATVEQKAATGAVAGAVVGGPVGAAVGGAAGTAVGQAQKPR